MFCEQFPRRWGFNNAGMSSPLTETLPISHASTSSYYVPFIFSQLQIHTWTWLKPDNHRSKDGSLSFKWSLWDQIAGNTNGHQMPLTSPSVHKSLWWQRVRINNHTGRLSNLWGISLSLVWPFSAEKSFKTRQEKRARCSNTTKTGFPPRIYQTIHRWYTIYW